MHSLCSRGNPGTAIQPPCGALAALPDPFDAATVSWSNGASHSTATLYFTGTVVGYTDRFDGDVGWVRDYRALGLRNLADYIPVTDSNTLSDAARFNMPANTIATIPSRMGRTVGQAVLAVLTMPQNELALRAAGIGAYTSAGTGATATATMAVGNTLATYGTITGLVLGTGGSGYGTTPPTVVIVGPCTTQAKYVAVLTSGAVTSFTQTNAGAGYTSTPTVIISALPADTISDLANLNIIAPFTLAFCGERLLSSIESVIQICHPNHWLYVLPSGHIRILDQRATTNYTVTLGNPSSSPEPDGTYGDRWLMPQLHRDSSDSYSQLIVRGGLSVSGVYLSVLPQADTAMNANITGPGASGVATGGLYPDFLYSGNTSNLAGTTGWTPNSFVQQSLQGGQDQGTITGFTDVSDFTIKSSNTALTLAANALDQNTGLHAIVTVVQNVVSGLNQMFSTSVIANGAMSAGGTCLLTVSPPLPVASGYTSYFLIFSSQAGNVVYRRYAVVDSSGWGPTSSMGPRLQQYFPYPFAYKNAAGTAAALTSAPVGSVLWSSSGSAPFNESDFSVTVDPSSGTITFPTPTSLVYGGGVVTPPSNITVFVPVANGSLQVNAPASGYAGTLYSVDGIQRIKTITIRDWTQESGVNLNIQTFANEQFDSIKDVVVEGSIVYLGLANTYLAPGYSVSITGQGYTTGWETLQSSPWPAGLPISQTQVKFKWNNSGTSYVTTLSLSNRKQRYTSDVFIRPAERGQMLGGQPFGAGYGTEWNKGLSNLGSFAPGILDSMLPGDGPPGDLSSLGMGGAGHRGVTIDDTNHQLQRQRRDERARATATEC